MSGERIRFVHTADLHLEQPLYGLSEIPDHLRDLLIDAPYTAARQVFELAVLEQVDFVIIAGDVADIARAGPRAIAFLEEQFQLLQERQIRVYWAGGECDATDNWTRRLQVPPNVHFFSGDEVEPLVHLRQGSPVVGIVGRSWSGSSRIAAQPFLGHQGELPTIAVGYGRLDEKPATDEISYWALGGSHQRRQSPGTFVVHCGTPQGRCPREPGSHGCTLVEINAAGEVRTKSQATDAVRFQTLDVSIGAQIEQADLEELINDTIEQARGEADSRPLLATLQVFGFDQVTTKQPAAVVAGQLRSALNARLGKATPNTWTLQVAIDPPDVYPEQWYQEATILGDFLRSVRDDDDDDETLDDLVRFLTERQRSGLASAICLDDESVRSRVLRKSALLGCELLRGERAIDLNAAATPEEYVL